MTSFSAYSRVYILASFFRDIPRELEEAALIDGATRFQAFRKVVIPLGASGVVTAGLLVFILEHEWDGRAPSLFDQELGPG